jgi:flagellar assembly factor FliW
MIISTTRFGALEIPDDKIITMAKPVLGFEQLKRYCLIEREDCEPFLWMQSTEDPAVAFIVVNPLFFNPEYRIEVNPKEVEELRITDVKAVETYAIVTIPANPAEMTINLQGPILINAETRLAKQLVLVNSEYAVCHHIFRETPSSADAAQKPEQVQPAMTV